MGPPQSGGFVVVVDVVVISCSLFFLSKAEGSTSVLFLDSSVHRYFRGRDSPESAALSLDEIGASVSVLLGWTPPTTLSASSSSEDGILKNVMPGSNKSSILLPEDKATFISLDGSVTSDCPSLTEAGISKFASLMGGAYVSDTSKKLSGQLTIPIQDGASLNLHMEKKTDMMYIANLISLVEGVTKAIEIHEDISLEADRPSELMKGSFHGITVLRDAYGNSEVTKQGLLVFLATLSKLHDLLKAAYKDQMAGVILLVGAVSSEVEPLLSVILASRPSARWLEETQAPSNSTEAEAVLVRWTLAWVTGVILLISTLFGIFLLLNMPLTKDTLLYANEKLD